MRTDTDLEQEFIDQLRREVERQAAEDRRPIIGSEIVVLVDYDHPRWRRVDRSRYDVISDDASAAFRFEDTGRVAVRMTYLAFDQPTSFLEAIAAALLTGEMTLCTRPDTESLFEQHPDIRLGGHLLSPCGQMTYTQGRLGMFYIGATARELSLLNYHLDHRWPAGHKFIFKKKP